MKLNVGGIKFSPARMLKASGAGPGLCYTKDFTESSRSPSQNELSKQNSVYQIFKNMEETDYKL